MRPAIGIFVDVNGGLISCYMQAIMHTGNASPILLLFVHPHETDDCDEASQILKQKKILRKSLSSDAEPEEEKPHESTQPNVAEMQPMQLM